MPRYFKATQPLYEYFRQQLDVAFGLPDAITQTSIEPAATAPHDAAGMVFLAVLEEFLTWRETQQMLQDAIASGDAEETTEQEFNDAVFYSSGRPQPPLP